ncbi:sugar phosphate isomerase/epimerase family protein [Staphylococcus succinus]|uniref:Sugar phosphate isomerase/epimerase n=1 Tax=Staphylococcus succinus TaxID=61015 RepID=A0ABX5IKG1_9STAP|nr:sugar phosphate isomerase/epimerase family protein [Staphylococcus succinus]PTI66387.1 sugar phosphate isomerase/epimerase [Staphylococcus succinus]RIN35996.1 sugar phosphate isomerase/epimerase [Staphylococcus succinus]
MRDYGFCFWSFGDISFEEKCKIAQDIGVDGVEVEGILEEDPIKIKDTLKKYNLKPLSITPANVDISSVENSIRKNAVEYFLDLIDWSKKMEAPRLCLHGDVGKVKGSEDNKLDWQLLVSSTKEIMEKAEKNNIEVVFEVLNRYENHQIVTCEEALKLIKDVNSPNLYILLDSYHMNIEEKNPLESIQFAGNKLGVYHVADSNRQKLGNGHSDIKNQIQALHSINYTGPIIMEMMAQGPNPFTPIKGSNYVEVLTNYYKDSLNLIKKWDYY